VTPDVPLGRRLGQVALVGVLMLAVAATVFGDRDGVDPRYPLLALGVVAAAVPLLGLLRHLPPDPTSAPGLVRRRHETGSTPPAPLIAWVGRVNGGTTSARAATLRLAPALRELTALRLADRRGVSIDHDPVASHRLLGDRAWGIVRADVSRSMDADGPGIPLDAVEELTTVLEDL
jgi:hypothetical protein